MGGEKLDCLLYCDCMLPEVRIEKKFKRLAEFSVFLPAYNLENYIEDTVNRVFQVLPYVAEKYEVIVVDDGSFDKTPELLKKLSAKYKNLKVLTHKVNGGYGEALKSGIYNSKYEWIAFIDADGQFDFSEIFKLVDKQRKTGADLVIGFYIKRAVSFSRKVNTWIWQVIVNFLFGLKVKDIDCGFKLFRKKVIVDLPKLESGRGAFISSEFLIKAKKFGFKIVEVGVNHYPRIGEKGTGANLDVILNSFVDLFKLWRKLN